MSSGMSDDATITTTDNDKYQDEMIERLFDTNSEADEDTCVEILTATSPSKNGSSSNSNSNSNSTYRSASSMASSKLSRKSSKSKLTFMSGKEIRRRQLMLQPIEEDVQSSLVQEDVRKVIAKIKSATERSKQRQINGSGAVSPGKFGELYHQQERREPPEEVADTQARDGPEMAPTAKDAAISSNNSSTSMNSSSPWIKKGYYKNVEDESDTISATSSKRSIIAKKYQKPIASRLHITPGRETDDLELFECVLIPSMTTTTATEEREGSEDAPIDAMAAFPAPAEAPLVPAKAPPAPVPAPAVEPINLEQQVYPKQAETESTTEDSPVTMDGDDEDEAIVIPRQEKEEKKHSKPDPIGQGEMMQEEDQEQEKALAAILTAKAPDVQPSTISSTVGPEMKELETLDSKTNDTPSETPREEENQETETDSGKETVAIVIEEDSVKLKALEEENASLKDTIRFLQRAASHKERYFAELAWFGKRTEEEVQKFRPNFWSEKREEFGPELFEEFRADAKRIADPEIGDWEHGFSSGALAMARLLLGLSHASVDEKICAFHDKNEPCTDQCVTCTVAQQRQRELEDFPVLDP